METTEPESGIPVPRAESELPNPISKEKCPDDNSTSLQDSKTAKQQVKSRYNNNTFAGFVAESLPEIEETVLCVKCKLVPNPAYYYVCGEKGHILCGFCALDPTLPGVDPCCDPDLLTKGSEIMLDFILKNSNWDCLYADAGCSVVANDRHWEDHVCDCAKRSKF